MLPENDIHKLCKIFARYPEIRAVYLFGSRAAGRARVNSDLDLGFFTKESATPAFKLEVDRETVYKIL